MSTKVRIIIVVVSLGTAFAVGRYTVPEKIKTVVQTVEVEKKVVTTDTDKKEKKHKEVVVTDTKNKDGSETTTTKTVEDTNLDNKTNDKIADNTSDTKTDSKEVTKTGSRLNISALGGVPISLSSGPGIGKFVYGVHVSRDLIGPISVGLWGLSSSEFGMSIGLTF